MGPAALDVIKIPAEKLQFRLFSIETLQCLVGNGEDLRGLKGGGPAEGHIQGHSLADHSLIGVHSGVLIALALGIVQQLGETLAGILLQCDIVIEDGGIRTQPSDIAGDGVDLRLEPGGISLPVCVGRVEVGGVPGILLRKRGALGDRFFNRHEKKPPVR